MAKDQEYEDAVQKGSELLRLLLTADNAKVLRYPNPPPGPVQSTFQGVEELARNGYEKRFDDTFALESLSKALQALDVNDKPDHEGGNNIPIHHEHTTSRRIASVSYPKTNAYFEQICNPTEGVLIAASNLGPYHAGRLKDPPVMNLPPLRHWSDVAFLQYISSRSEQTTGPITLKYIFRATIQNVLTYSILNRIMLKHALVTYETWPGVTFEVGSEEGRAILGTPHGSGVAWLLMQHKTQLGDKQIEKITMFYAENEGDLYRWPSLLFWIV